MTATVCVLAAVDRDGERGEADCAASTGQCAAWQWTNNWLGLIRLWLERAFSVQYFWESNARQTKTRTNI